MKIVAIAATLTILVAPLTAQPTPPTLTGVTLRSQIGITNSFSPTKTAQTSPCSSSPYTADSEIYTVALVIQPHFAGFEPSASVGQAGIIEDTADPSKVFFITGDPGITEIKTTRKAYPSAFSAASGAVVIPNLSWADASDILSSLQSSTAMVTDLRTAVATRGNFSLVPITLKDDHDIDDVVIALGAKGVKLFSSTGWTTAVELLRSGEIKDEEKKVMASAGTAIPIKLPTDPTAISTSFDQAPRDLQNWISGNQIAGKIKSSNAGVAGAPTPDLASALKDAIFIVDSPCLTVELLPSLMGGDSASGEVRFTGRYLIPFAKGNSFARFNAHGSSPINQDNGAKNSFGAVFDLAINRDMASDTMTGPVRFTAGLTATYDRANGDTKTSKGSGGLKGSVSFPNLMLAGNDTRPTLTFEAVGSNNRTEGGESSSQLEASSAFKAKFRWTPIFNSAVDAAYHYSKDRIYGGRQNNYLITIDVLKFVVRDPMEFAATWKCGRQAPDYKRVCGFFTGISMTSHQ